jgi:DHA1 family bicyclomycin/chloramphenicol resistance-like MFS transporter
MKSENMMANNRLLLLLALLAAFPPLSTDMYLPAIPILVKAWQQPLTVVNLTLVGFFISYCIFLLGYGPLSDRFGRRRPLLAGIGIFIFASALCASAQNITAMIIFRMMQAAGAASASTLALAISKDVYAGNQRERVLAHIGIIMALAPMLAPVIGGYVLTWFSWRWIFAIQAVIAVVAGIGVFRMPETLKEPSPAGLRKTAGIYARLLGNRRYVRAVLMMSVIVLPAFAFIGGSPDIYITRLGLSERAFGYFFGVNAMAIMAGSFACSRLLRRVRSRALMTFGFIGIMIGGMGMLWQLFPGPFRLAIPMGLISFSFGLSRPPSNNYVLEQVDQYAGAASSILIFCYFLTGAFAMWLISLNWNDKIQVVGILATASGALILVLWQIQLARKSRPRK